MRWYWTWVDGAHLIPVDQVAEEGLAAWAITDQRLAAIIKTRLKATDLHYRTLWDVIEAAVLVGPDVNDRDEDWAAPGADLHLMARGCLNRTHAIAKATGIEVALLREIVLRRTAERVDPLMARCVLVAGARLACLQLCEQLESFGVDLRLIYASDDVREGVIGTAQAFTRAVVGTASDSDVVDSLLRLGELVGTGDLGPYIVDAAQQEDDTP